MVYQVDENVPKVIQNSFQAHNFFWGTGSLKLAHVRLEYESEISFPLENIFDTCCHKMPRMIMHKIGSHVIFLNITKHSFDAFQSCIRQNSKLHLPNAFCIYFVLSLIWKATISIFWNCIGLGMCFISLVTYQMANAIVQAFAEVYQYHQNLVDIHLCQKAWG